MDCSIILSASLSAIWRTIRAETITITVRPSFRLLNRYSDFLALYNFILFSVPFNYTYCCFA